MNTLSLANTASVIVANQGGTAPVPSVVIVDDSRINFAVDAPVPSAYVSGNAVAIGSAQEMRIDNLKDSLKYPVRS
jgi:hypothetical protein